MRSLPTALLLVALATISAPRPSAGASARAVQAAGCSAVHVLSVARQGVVEPADADAPEVGMAPPASMTGLPSTAAPATPIGLIVRPSPPLRRSALHLLARATHPATAPPVPRAPAGQRSLVRR